MKRFAWLLFASLSGCSLLLGIEDLPSGSAPDAADDPPDAMPPPPAVLSIDVERYDMGAAIVGVASVPARVTITNAGTTKTGALTPAFASPRFAAGGACMGAELDPGASCAVDMVFTPDAAGALETVLTVSAYGGGQVTTVVLAEGLEALTLDTNRDTIDFGLIAIDGAGPLRFLEVTNPGAATLSGNMTVRVTGQDARWFAVSRNECGGYSLADGGR